MRLESLPQTLFQVQVNARAIDLTQPPLLRDEQLWTSRDNYQPCQQLARMARDASTEAIRYRSVRDPQAGPCMAVLTPDALAVAPTAEQTWRLAVTRERVQWQRDSALHEESFEFQANYTS
jgi:RES domain